MPAIFHDQVQKELERPITDFVLPPNNCGGQNKYLTLLIFLPLSLFH